MLSLEPIAVSKAAGTGAGWCKHRVVTPGVTERVMFMKILKKLAFLV